jgi:hypothetical protein
MKNVTYNLAIVLVIAAGCETPDERLVHQLAETNREVLHQNQEIARTHHELAEGSKQLVEAVAESRQEHNAMQRELQQQRDSLDSERRAIAVTRNRESLLVPFLSTAGVFVVATLPLVLCWYLLHGLRCHDDDVSEVLVRELVQHAPDLLGAQRDQQAIEQQPISTDDQEPPF